VLREVAEILPCIGPPAKTLVPFLRAQLDNKLWSIQSVAVESLGNLGYLAAEALPDLTALPDILGKADAIKKIAESQQDPNKTLCRIAIQK
jgi:hypothetical protein